MGEDEEDKDAEAKAEDEFLVNYFAYGSNVGSKTFSTRRNIQPKRVQNGKILDYQLSFNVPGVPFLEPAFASVTRQKGEETHGVCYTITKDEFRYLLQTEGSRCRGCGCFCLRERDIEGVDGEGIKHAAMHERIYSRQTVSRFDRGRRKRGLEKLDRVLEKMPYFDPNEKPLNAFEMSVLLAVSFGRFDSGAKIFDVVFSFRRRKRREDVRREEAHSIVFSDAGSFVRRARSVEVLLRKRVVGDNKDRFSSCSK